MRGKILSDVPRKESRMQKLMDFGFSSRGTPQRDWALLRRIRHRCESCPARDNLMGCCTLRRNPAACDRDTDQDLQPDTLEQFAWESTGEGALVIDLGVVTLQDAQAIVDKELAAPPEEVDDGDNT